MPQGQAEWDAVAVIGVLSVIFMGIMGALWSRQNAMSRRLGMLETAIAGLSNSIKVAIHEAFDRHEEQDHEHLREFSDTVLERVEQKIESSLNALRRDYPAFDRRHKARET